MFRQPLHNCLKDYKGRYVKIGAKGGNGFFYCDKVGKDIDNTLNVISMRYYNNMKNLLKKSEDFLANIDTYYDKKISAFKEKAKKQKNLQHKVDTFVANCYKKKEKDLTRLPKLIMSLKSQIQVFTPLGDRKVVEILPSISPDEPTTTIIYVRGREVGKFWTIKEYQDRNKEIKRGLHNGIIK